MESACACAFDNGGLYTAMMSDGRNTFVVKGYNVDVMSVVMETYSRFKNQPAELMEELYGRDADTVCESVFDYVIDNVRYVEDPEGVQLVKTPARLLKDGQGDCKSMAIFIGACLHCVNIPFVFRFVGFTDKKIYNHVYIVAYPGSSREIVLDPVERVDGEPVYNYARGYKVKKDIRG